MTLQEFLDTSPQSYGTGNMNLLYSSSVSGSDNVPIAPFTLQGLAVPFLSANGVNVAAALKEVDTFRFDYTTGQLSARITGRQQKNNFYYFTFEEIVVNQLPGDTNFSGDPIIEDSPAVFVPFVTLNFNNSDYNPLANNSEGSKRTPIQFRIDRDASQFNPSNLTAIISGSATAAELQECSFTKTGIINGKYNGSKTTAAGPISRQYHKQLFTTQVNDNAIDANEPAVNLVTFKASLHASDAGTTAVKNILNADRDIKDVLFDSALSGSHPKKIFPSFAKLGNTIFGLQGNSTFKLTNNKIYSIDTDEVLTTNNFGVVTLVE